MMAKAVGGIEDHVHALLSLPATLAISKAMQLIKGNASKWIHETFSDLSEFAWQDGYGAFGIGISGVDATRNYIARQVEHHRKRTFREEMDGFLRKHHMQWTERDATDQV